ncbi:hypothetical protein [Kitasatospora cinereorecta]
MPTATELGTSHYLQQQRTVRRAQRLWRALDPYGLDREWAALGPALTQLVTDSQQQAAAPAQDYVFAVLAATEPPPARPASPAPLRSPAGPPTAAP